MASARDLPAEPAMNSKFSKMGEVIAVGYYAYLKDFVFEGLSDRQSDFEDIVRTLLADTDIIILVPNLCRASLKDYQSENNKILRYVDNLPKVLAFVAGTKDRPYQLSVYELVGKGKLFILEMAQCLDVLFNVPDLTDNERMQIREKFVTVLSSCLDADESTRGQYKIVHFKREDDLQELILGARKIKMQMSYPLISNTENIGTGLAYWFFYNYLNLLIPGLPDAMKNWEEKQKMPLVKVVCLLIPNSCFCPKNIKDPKDKNIQYAYDLNENQNLITIGATHGRIYKKCVLKIKHDEKKLFCIAEYVTTIRQLYRMYNELLPLKLLQAEENNAENLMKQRHEFTTCLNELLKNHRSIFKIISFEDKPENTDFILSNMLWKKLQKMAFPTVNEAH